MSKPRPLLLPIAFCFVLGAVPAACNSTLHTGKKGTGGAGSGGAGTGGAGGQTQSSTATGGSGGATSNGGATSLGGNSTAIGGMGGGGMGAAAATEPAETRPPRPAWTPPFTATLGAPGWLQSTQPICDTNQGLSAGFDAWADERGVFALVAEGCNEFAGYSCGLHGATLKFNSGSGWQVHYQFTPGTISYPRLWGGFPNGPMLITGTMDGQPAAFVGKGSLALQTTLTGASTGFVAGPDLAYVADDTGPLMYASGAWSRVGTNQNTLYALWADSQTLVAVGPDQTVLVRQGAGPLTSLPGVPAGTYGAVWAFGPSDIWLGNTAAQLVHFDGSKWQVYSTRSRDISGGGILQLWGAESTLYFSTYAEFGRWTGAGVEMLLEPPAGAEFSAYVGQFGRFWGRSATEVFLPLRDSRYRTYACGSTFMLWFDGKQFHQF